MQAHLVLGLLLAALAFAPGCSKSSAPNGPPAAPANDEGAQVFAMACARCHGPQGGGDGPLAARLGYVPNLQRPLARPHVLSIVQRGRGAMPGHADRLSAAQIEAVADHVERLGAR
jgi:mono/diheme cytochrome c family protein